VLSSVKRSDITTHYNHIAGVFELWSAVPISTASEM
jgi:hypothetical protein